MVLFPKELKISKSMTKILKKNTFEITENQAFEEVIHQCKNIIRNDNLGTWITDEMIEAYIKLHKLGYAKSIEVWENKELVGGLYGIDLKNGVFCGESMFSLKKNASKICIAYLAAHLIDSGFKIIDTQFYSDHLSQFGTIEIPQEEYLKILNENNLKDDLSITAFMKFVKSLGVPILIVLSCLMSFFSTDDQIVEGI